MLENATLVFGFLVLWAEWKRELLIYLLAVVAGVYAATTAEPGLVIVFVATMIYLIMRAVLSFKEMGEDGE